MAPIRIPSGSHSSTTGGASTAPTASGWDYILKFILIGDSSVGKSSLLVRLTDDRFLTDPDPTIGVEFGSHLIQLDNGETVKVQVWDTAGSESFRSITRSYYRGAAGALLVYDVTHRASFLNAKTWLDDVRSHAEEKVTVVLVGNMQDLVASEDEEGGAAGSAADTGSVRSRTDRRRSKGKKREVSYQEASEFAQQEGLLFLETSAKTGHNVQKAFEQAAKDIHNKFSSISEDGGGSGGGVGGKRDDSTIGRRKARAGGRTTSATITLDGNNHNNHSGFSVRGVTDHGGNSSRDGADSSGFVDDSKGCCIIA